MQQQGKSSKMKKDAQFGDFVCLQMSSKLNGKNPRHGYLYKRIKVLKEREKKELKNATRTKRPGQAFSWPKSGKLSVVVRFS